jgi:hypothetical protein
MSKNEIFKSLKPIKQIRNTILSSTPLHISVPVLQSSTSTSLPISLPVPVSVPVPTSISVPVSTPTSNTTQDIDIEFDTDETPERCNNLEADTEDMDRILLNVRDCISSPIKEKTKSISSKRIELPAIRTKLKSLDFDSDEENYNNDNDNDNVDNGEDGDNGEEENYNDDNGDNGDNDNDDNGDNDNDVDVEGRERESSNKKNSTRNSNHNNNRNSDRNSNSGNNSGNSANGIDLDQYDSSDSKSDTTTPVKKSTIRKKIQIGKKASDTKKGPGRPRKIPKKEPIPRKGIIRNPTIHDAVVEFLYDQPLVMKKIIGFFKSLASAQIQILFRPTNIILYALDHHKKSKMYVKIDASKLNHYYCKSVLDIGISCKDLESTLDGVDKEYSSIILISTAGHTQKNLSLILENDIQIDETHTIDLIGQYDHMDNEHEFIDEDYMVKFEWPGKYFRKTINDIKSASSQISISQEDCDAPMEIGYTSANKKIRSKHIVKNPEKIKFISCLDGDSSFRVDVKIDYIKPISSAHIADEIMIMVDENKKFMTKAFIDNKTIEIKTLTEIIDDRPDDD